MYNCNGIRTENTHAARRAECGKMYNSRLSGGKKKTIIIIESIFPIP